MEKEIVVLGIETSCDETSAAIVVNGRVEESNVIYSQIDIHQAYGGVVPEIASRNHVKKIAVIVEEAFQKANRQYGDVDVVAATYGPGLVGSLLVGLSYGKAFAYGLNKPFVGVNHIDAHICANYIGNEEVTPSFVTLVASGGHSHLIYVEDYGKYEVLGQTRDDAAGEAFDKIARALGLGYPGGPAIEKAALLGDKSLVRFPRAYLEEDSYDFSFSGLKSAVLNHLNHLKMKEIDYKKEDIAASFQDAVVDVLVQKTVRAAKERNLTRVCLSGGVACNQMLRSQLQEKCMKEGISLHYPNALLCTDNASMVASAGYFAYKNGEKTSYSVSAKPNLKIDSIEK
ncbi:MAG TPA: tRNA (adenosine(37)-N6)-threonylcarbamoyltransferase complex transferase subunit TsaD [Eubacteriaceae bacterium]|nr:tRNA (adenosine(37)-N6)-threonylcarbamoyltransferase complex transferase subunit TsaD [Eubacteriaceae bacterium]